MVALATYYHKGYQLSREAKVIFRYLPREVGEMVVLYLWLVHPFLECLQVRAQKGGSYLSTYLFASDGKGQKWSSDRMKKALVQSSLLHLGCRVTIASWRHMATAIHRRFLRTQVEEDRGKNRGTSPERNQMDKGAVADHQSAHSMEVAERRYGRMSWEHRGVVAFQRQLFRASSAEWGSFWGLESSSSPRYDDL